LTAVKTWLPVILAFAIECVAESAVPVWPGRASPFGRLGASEITSEAASEGVPTSGMGSVRRSGPRVAVEQERYDFGRSDVDTPGRQAFLFTNIGTEPLVLSRGRSTCGCCTCVCDVRLPEGAVAPGNSAQVTLEWQSKLYVGRFRQTATILTNDPARPEVTLSIAGRFTGPVGVAPSQLVLSGVRLGESVTSEVRVYSYLEEMLAITGYELSNRPIGQYYDVTWQRLAAEHLQEEGEARSGYLVRVTLKAGLPVGTFQQAIRLTTTSSSIPIVEIPVQGAVVPDIGIAGRGWNAETGTLTMGTFSSAEGAKWSLLIVVRGPHAKDIRLKPVRLVPAALEVELGATRYVAETAVSLTPLMIRIPPGHAPSTHLGGERGEPGWVTLQTNHPQLPELPIQVRFAVRE